MLLDKPSPELKITIERVSDLEFKYGNATGASLSMEFDGLTVSAVEEGSAAFEAGLTPNDIITAINGNSTRYMPLKKANALIKRSRDGKVNLIVKKDMIMWGKGGS